MKEIPLTQGKVALVDDEDFEWLSQYKWCAHKRSPTFYAVRNIHIGGKAVTIGMHREILKTPFGFETDHINHDGLDNRRINLRVCTRVENMRNLRIKNRTGFKGVSRYEIKGHVYIYASITIKSRALFLGSFRTLEDAARAYDAKAKELFGEFALLNFPEGAKR